MDSPTRGSARRCSRGSGATRFFPRARIALFRVYGAESAIYAEARSLDTLVWRFCMGPLALLGGDPRAARPALRLALALIWLCALYWVVLPRLP